MKRVISLLLFLLVLFSQTSYPQYKGWGMKFGLRGSLLFPENEYSNLGISGYDNFSFKWFRTSVLGEAYAGFELSKLFELHFSAGYGSYTGNAIFKEGTDYGYYETGIIPIAAQLRFAPFNTAYWNPYISIGAGALNYRTNTFPGITSPVIVKSNAWTGFVPFSIGAEFRAFERIFFDIALGGAFGSTREMDAYRGVNNMIWDGYANISLGITYTMESCATDYDKDGIEKCDENMIGSDPDNPDTDGDGLSDGEEYLTYKTSPINIDSDYDGIRDSDELKQYKTDPLNQDSDNDGLKDGDEIRKYKTNPLLADTDSDSLSDRQEVISTGTDPLNSDTDNDNLSDSKELNEYKTNPLKDDSDGDGLSDSEEILKYKTNPFMKDTDRGSVNDLAEVVRGSDPLDSRDDVVDFGVNFVLEGITFDPGKSIIKPSSQEFLMKALKILQMNPGIRIEISGHTDNAGNAAANKKLSLMRADAVKDWFVSKGISPNRLSTYGYGEEFPRFPNDTPENRELNRRIEIKRTE